MPAPLRKAEEVKAARQAMSEEHSLVIGQSVHKVIRSRRAIVATRIRLITLSRDRQKIR